MVTTSTNLTTNRSIGRAGQDVDIIGIHTMEAPEGSQTAENVANYFKKVKASSHWCCDDNSRVRVVQDKDTAWTLPGANSRSLNIELAGYARQTAGDWADAYSLAMLDIAAQCAAEWVIKYGIPIRRLTDAQIRSGAKGFAGHVDVNRVYKQSSHWDPGPAFPWDYFLGRVAAFVGGGATPVVNPVTPVPPAVAPNWDNRGYSMEWIASQQAKLIRLGYDLGPGGADGKRGPRTATATADFQSKNGLDPDGIPGPLTSTALDRALAPAPVTRPNCQRLQRAVRTADDNAWGDNTDKHCNAVREASNWGGNDYPWGVAFTQRVVGTDDDGVWGKNSVAAHDRTVVLMQDALKSMGFDAGISDGKWGDRTEGAYQAARRACRI